MCDCHKKTGGCGCQTGGRKLPEAIKIRGDLAKQIVKDTNFKGMWVPVIKTVAWIADKSKETDSVKKSKEAVKYYESHKSECQRKLEEFKKEWESKKGKKGSKKASRTKGSRKSSKSSSSSTRKSSKRKSKK